MKKALKSVPHQQTFAYRQTMRLGAAIADQLPKMMSATECARRIGVNTHMLRRIECQALAKVALNLRQVMLRDGIDLPLIYDP